MLHINSSQSRRRGGGVRLLALTAVLGSLVLGACDNPLNVVDPDIITPPSLQGAAGVSALHVGAVSDFNFAYSGAGTDGVIMFGGLLTDEWYHSGTFSTRQETDIRQINDNNGTLNNVYLNMHQARVAAARARAAVIAFDPTDTRIGELHLYEGLTYLGFAENWCGHVPFSTAENPADGEASSVTFQRAVDQFTSAMGTPATTDVVNAARVALGRALMGLSDYAGAAIAVAPVPDGARFFTEHSLNTFSERNGVYERNTNQLRWSVPDGEGGALNGGLSIGAEEGLPFRSALDPRITYELDPELVGFDKNTPQWDLLTAPLIPGDPIGFASSIAILSGIEARLIEAEAAAVAGNVAAMVTFLDDLRTGSGLDFSGVSAQPNYFTTITDQGANGTVDTDDYRMLFAERGFWTYGTGKRLADSRRMVRDHGFAATSVFPTGLSDRGATFGTDVNLRVTIQEENNPAYNPAGCNKAAP